MSRNPAARGKQDSNQKPIADAIRLLGYPVMDLSHAGGGVEDLLVGLTVPVEGFTHRVKGWLLVEVKVEHPERSKTEPIRFTKAQKEWRAKTAGWPRLTVVSAQDAVDQIRALTG